jgi:electron transport complex protein RnfG
MKKLESNFKNMVLVLSSITLFAALILSSLYSVTKEPIAKSKLAKEQNAIKEVLPPYDHFDANAIIVQDGVETMKVYKAYDKKNTFVGAAVETTSNNGFSGNIDIMVGFDNEGVIINYKVLEQHETPGLGTKMVDWFKMEIKNQSIIGKNAGTANLSVTKSGGEIDAITAATISSKAFLFAVRNAYYAYSKNVENLDADILKSSSNSKNSSTDSTSTLSNSKIERTKQ